MNFQFYCLSSKLIYFIVLFIKFKERESLLKLWAWWHCLSKALEQVHWDPVWNREFRDKWRQSWICNSWILDRSSRQLHFWYIPFAWVVLPHVRVPWLLNQTCSLIFCIHIVRPKIIVQGIISPRTSWQYDFIVSKRLPIIEAIITIFLECSAILCEWVVSLIHFVYLWTLF